MQERVVTRRLHTIGTAADEWGVDDKVVRKLLIDAGVIAKDDSRPARQITFDADRYAGLLKEIGALVGINEMRSSIGATRAEFSALVDDGLIQRMTDKPGIKNPWRLREGVDLVAELSGLSHPVDDLDRNWEPLQRARARTGLSLMQIIEAIRSGRISLGQVTGRQGYGGFVVRRDDASLLATELLGKARRDAPALPGVMSALEFSVLVRLQKTGDLLGLFGDGHSPSIQTLHPVTKRQQLRLDEIQIRAFHEKFVTVETISNALGLSNKCIRGALEAQKIPVFEIQGKSYGPIYLRKEARRAFPKLPATTDI